MTNDDLLRKAFAFTGKYRPEELYDFRQDGDFMVFLHTRFPFVEDFLRLCGLVYDEKCNLAAIGLPAGKPVIKLNPWRLTYIYKGAEKGDWPVSLFYETLGCLLWHEVLHIELRHFRHAYSGAESSRWNVAQDMVIDNLIHSRYPGWRNWADYVQKINERIDETGKGTFLSKIAVDAPAEGKTHISQLWDRDLVVYFNLLELDVSEPDRQRVDEHNHGGTPDPLDKPAGGGGGGSSQNKAPGEDLFDKLESAARKRNEKAEKNGPMMRPELGDIVAQKTGEARRYNLLRILRSYLQKISLKRKTYSWKKIGRKQPGYRPGVINKKTPGEVLFIVDTSGSMVDYLSTEFSGLLKELYFAFEQLNKMQGASFSSFFQMEADTEIRNIKPIKNPQALKELADGSRLLGGGNTDYAAAFDCVINSWREVSGSGQKLPDLILFLTDLDTNYEFLSGAAYSPLNNRLIWLYPGRGHPPSLPCRGAVYNVFPDDYGANWPYYSQGENYEQK